MKPASAGFLLPEPATFLQAKKDPAKCRVKNRD
jgi:hypothetical protein